MVLRLDKHRISENIFNTKPEIQNPKWRQRSTREEQVRKDGMQNIIRRNNERNEREDGEVLGKQRWVV
jgi:hypothetical protein